MDTTLLAFYHAFFNVCFSFLPAKVQLSHPGRNKLNLLWLTPALRIQVKPKRDSYSLCKKYPNTDNLAHCKSERNKARNMSRKAQRGFISSLTSLSSAHGNLPAPNIFQFVRQARSGTTASSDGNGVAQLCKENTVHTDPVAIADALNTQFVNFGTKDDPSWSVPDFPQHHIPPLTSVFTTPSRIKKYSSQFKVKKATAVGGISHELLRLLSPAIVYPLSILFNITFSTGVFPSLWKHSIVTPI